MDTPKLVKQDSNQNNNTVITPKSSNSNISSDSAEQVKQNIQLMKGFDYMTMEFCRNGDLFDVVKKNGKLSEGLAKNLFHQLLDGIEFLHNNVGVAHLDLKLENILVSDTFDLKLCDFGFYEELKSSVCKNRGTHGYRAPETYFQLNDGFDGAKADMFSLGVILFIMVFGVPPFN